MLQAYLIRRNAHDKRYTARVYQPRNYTSDRIARLVVLQAANLLSKRPLLTFGPRFWTGYIDSCVLWPVGFITAVLSFLDIPRVLTAGLTITHTVVWLIYTVVMHARYGQTVGKMATKVRVVDFRTEGSISWRQAWLREGIPVVLSIGFLVWMVFLTVREELNPNDIRAHEALAESRAFWFLAALPGLWFIAEVLTMLTNEKRRALHDFIAGTVVVRTNIEDCQRGHYTYNVNPGDLSTPTTKNSATSSIPPD